MCHSHIDWENMDGEVNKKNVMNQISKEQLFFEAKEDTFKRVEKVSYGCQINVASVCNNTFTEKVR